MQQRKRHLSKLKKNAIIDGDEWSVSRDTTSPDTKHHDWLHWTESVWTCWRRRNWILQPKTSRQQTATVQVWTYLESCREGMSSRYRRANLFCKPHVRYWGHTHWPTMQWGILQRQAKPHVLRDWVTSSVITCLGRERHLSSWS